MADFRRYPGGRGRCHATPPQPRGLCRSVLARDGAMVERSAWQERAWRHRARSRSYDGAGSRGAAWHLPLAPRQRGEGGAQRRVRGRVNARQRFGLRLYAGASRTDGTSRSVLFMVRQARHERDVGGSTRTGKRMAQGCGWGRGCRYTIPSSKAFNTARVRSRTPSLERMLETWFLTVPSATLSEFAISLFEYPPAIRRRISVSRSVKGSG